jgi:hypothetical protein
MPRYRIHPGIGVARVGDAPNAFFVGPEHPDVPANWQDGSFQSFRDSGQLKRQGAKFRVFEYEEDAQGRLSLPKELTIGGEIKDIEWRVHVANRKASFFTFYGQDGFDDFFVERNGKPAHAPEKPAKDGDPARLNLRNPGIQGDARKLLDIDPGEQLISRASPGPVTLANLNPDTKQAIADLGELHLDDAGRPFLRRSAWTDSGVRQQRYVVR